MAVKSTIKFETLASGTALVTPAGAGKFITYKKGNFKNQDVLVEHAFGNRRWYSEEVLRLADVYATATLEANRMAFSNILFAYDF